jgi:hypothetical protein
MPSITLINMEFQEALQSLLSHHTMVSILQLPKQLLKRHCQIAVHTRAHVVAGALMVKPVDPPRYISHIAK